MQVVHASSEDAHSVAEIQVQTWQVAYRGIVPEGVLSSLAVPKYEAMWNENIKKGVPELLVAKEDGQVLGWVAFGQSRDADASPTEAEIWAIYVASNQWGKGVGRSLWLHAQAHMLEAGFKAVSLWAFPQNVRAAAFYHAVGFTSDASTMKWFTLGEHQQQEIRYARALDG